MSSPSLSRRIARMSIGQHAEALAQQVHQGRHGEDGTAAAERAEGWPRSAGPRRPPARSPAHTTRPSWPPAATTGSPARAQACIPPDRLITSRPSRASSLAARADRWPERHTVTTVRRGGRFFIPAGRRLSGMCRAPGACPARHSGASRTSSRIASWRISWLACFALALGRRRNRRPGQPLMPPSRLPCR